MKKNVLLFLVLGFWGIGGVFPPAAQAQRKQAVTLKYFALSYHLQPARNPEIFRNRLDERGIAVLNYGLIAGYDRYLRNPRWRIRVEQGLYADCTASLAGFWHIGWRAQIFSFGRHSLNGGIGPTLVFRRDWNRIPGYTDDHYFARHGSWQYKFFIYGGEFEYNYALNAQNALSLTVIPGLPELVSFGVGFRRAF